MPDETRLLASFLASVPVPLVAVDARARVIGASPPALAMLGASIDGRPFVTVIRHPAVNEALEAVIGPAPAPKPNPSTAASVAAAPRIGPASPESGQRLRAVLSAGGRDHACEVTVNPFVIAGGTGALIAIEDLTALDQAEQTRRDFVANVSHELRTPLTALMGFIETLRGPARDDPAARERFLTIMEREAGRMNRLVADLLSLSRVESEERRRPAGRVDLAALIRGTVATLSHSGDAHGLRLVPVGIDRPVHVPGDADQLVQVMHNLVENAIKYSGGRTGAEVRVSLARVEHEPMLRGPAWAIEVADEGEGIDPFHLPRLTERFYRIDTHRSREQGGTGLGLAIVKHIVSRHRGRLKIESEQGRGSRFTVILPEAIEGRR